MSNDDDPTAQSANTVIEEVKAKGCVDRGEGRGKCHVYLEGATECVCKDGQKLELRRMK